MFYNHLYYWLCMILHIKYVFHFFSTALCAGTSETQVFDEQSPSGNDYLAEVKRNVYCHYQVYIAEGIFWENFSRRYNHILPFGVKCYGTWSHNRWKFYSLVFNLMQHDAIYNCSFQTILINPALSFQVCREWELTALKVNGDVRVALIRIGVVLGKDGGALGMKYLTIRHAYGLEFTIWHQILCFMVFYGSGYNIVKQYPLCNARLAFSIKNKKISANDL